MNPKSDTLLKYFTSTKKKYFFIHKKYSNEIITNLITFKEFIEYVNKYNIDVLNYGIENYIKENVFEYIEQTYNEKYGFVEMSFSKRKQDIIWFYALYNEDNYKSEHLKTLNFFEHYHIIFFNKSDELIFIENAIKFLRKRKIDKIFKDV